MSAIYQRARPIRWEDIVGQEHVKDVLRTALEQGRVGHAYLFSGPRGVGKTTTARLIAMTANCTTPGIKPCGECESCLAVRSGNHPDVMEIDAASNNSVDDVRDLREKVGLAAMRGGKKIYILDEAHMMTRSAFNALLKTLEEPPSHVIFILATTEPEKIIPTILSRCQHYRFRRLTPEEIAGKLAGLVSQEGLSAEADALQLIGRLADGAMRDGESLLERMLAAGTAITRPAVEDALGLPPGERVRGIAGALVLGDAGTALAGAAALYRDGFAARTVVEGLVAAFGAALHAELGLESGGKLEGAEVPRLLKLQAALDQQESRFARSADQQSLELALTHAILAADGGNVGAASGNLSGGSASSAAPNNAARNSAAQVPADLVQRLNRLEKELATLRGSGGQAGGGRSAAPVIPDFDTAQRRVGTPVREAKEQVIQAPPGSSLPTTSWKNIKDAADVPFKPFLRETSATITEGLVTVELDAKWKYHTTHLVSKFDDLCKLIWKFYPDYDVELSTSNGIQRAKSRTVGSVHGVAAAIPVGDLQEPRLVAPPTQHTALAEISDFDPAPRRNVQRAAPLEPVAPQATSHTADAADSHGEFPPAPADPPAPTPQAPSAPPPRRTNVATLEREHRVDPPSPDDRAAAPLPDEPFGAWEKEHVADVPTAPADASGGDLVTPPGQSRELYVVEAITEEPDWGDIGGSFGGAQVGPDLGDSPFEEFVPKRPAPPPAAPASQPQPPRSKGNLATVSTGPAAPGAPSRPGDIRAHPLYEEVKSRFSGRVREIGKNRNYQATVTGEGAGDEETDALEQLS
ncbi:DNA polymerase III subunit gamma/tau [Deinococcus sp.]|uniref:DNA polymerase III subunit gamma/tau n=1 Tax=Deinococcus sp. TaxID=47478 RepID=UPI0025BA8D4D|nr:DNA polymerase III subunit gamma/tau [Deinococcus sp.]